MSVKHDASPVFESQLGIGHFAFGDGIKVDAFSELLAGKAVDIPNSTALPKTKRTTKANFVNGAFRQIMQTIQRRRLRASNNFCMN